MNKPMHYLLLLLLMIVAFSQACKRDQPDSANPGIEFKNTENIVYTRLPAEPDVLNPMQTTNSYSRQVYEQIFQPLLGFDPKTLELSPVLVTGRPEMREITEGPNAGGVAYTFTIVPEARWDDGTPVTAKDVVFTFKALFNPKIVKAAPYRAYLDMLKDIEVDPQNPARFTVLTNQKYILSEAAIGNMGVYPAHVYDPDGLLNDIPLSSLTDPAKAEQLAADTRLDQFAQQFSDPKYARDTAFVSGSGPYRLVRWEPGQEIVLERKANWWGDDLAERYPLLQSAPEQLVFRIIPDPATTVNAFKEERIDVANQLDTKDFTDLKANEYVNQRFNFMTPQVMQYFYIAMNTKNPKLNDKRVRRAMAHLLDVDQVIAQLYDGLAERIVGPFHPSKAYYADNLDPIPFDPARARELLKEAGWEDTNGNGTVDKQIGGQRQELQIDYLVAPTSTFGQNLATFFQESARQAGVAINIVPTEFRTIIDMANRREYDMFGGGFSSDPLPDDPKQLWHTESDTPGGGNRTSFGNAQSDALIDAVRTTLDEGERNRLYKDFQQIVYDEQPMIFLFAPQDRLVISKRFKAEPTLVRPGYMVNHFVQLDRKVD